MHVIYLMEIAAGADLTHSTAWAGESGSALAALKLDGIFILGALVAIMKGRAGR